MVSGFAHKSGNYSGFATGTSSECATVRQTLNCVTAHSSKFGKQKLYVLYTISFSAVGGSTSVFELYRANIILTISSSREFRETCGCGLQNATLFGSLWCRLTCRRVADAVRKSIATVATRNVCTTRNWNENLYVLPNWCKMQKLIGT